MDTSMNNTRPDLHPGVTGVRRQTHGMRPDMLPRALFVADVLAERLAHIAYDQFRGSAEPDALARCGTPVLVRCDREEGQVEAYLRVPGGVLALVHAGHQDIRIEVAGTARQAARSVATQLRQALIADEPPADRISVGFWMRGEYGGEVRHRKIDAECFDDIAENYPGNVRKALARLVAIQSPERGRLILWRGEPGTGKSHALRSLARAWAPWCTAHFIMDPEELLGHGGAYMLELLTWEDGSDDERWRLLILEDAGELIAADARAAAGQALSRLLNVADGLLGQGTRTLVLITTNEPVGRLHPAARRDGRCLADVEFTPFTADEATAWLDARDQPSSVEEPMTLAELFSRVHGTPLASSTVEIGFGFARALNRGSDENRVT
jgi:Domain of unknown function (DUF5925)/ATPase family associated with various cellular activities (AAA)